MEWSALATPDCDRDRDRACAAAVGREWWATFAVGWLRGMRAPHSAAQSLSLNAALSLSLFLSRSLCSVNSSPQGIPIGKLSLYTAAAGIHPSKCLPVVLDVGTNNESLLKDPFYLGLQHKRITGDSYLAVVDEFVRAIRERYPRALIQFEDFSNENAARLLEKYRHKVLCFNDDIQGTGTAALAGVLGALRCAGQNEPDALSKQRIVIVGAGTAGLGVANALKMGMVRFAAAAATNKHARTRARAHARPDRLMQGSHCCWQRQRRQQAADSRGLLSRFLCLAQ